MPQFDFSSYSSQIFWLIVSFSFFYIFVYKFIVPASKKIFASRQVVIQDHIEQTEKLTLEIEDLNQYYDSEIAKLENEIRELKKTALDSLESNFLLEKTNLENALKKQMLQSTVKIHSNSKEFWDEEKGTSTKLAAIIIEKITNTPADLDLLKNISRNYTKS